MEFIFWVGLYARLRPVKAEHTNYSTPGEVDLGRAPAGGVFVRKTYRPVFVRQCVRQPGPKK